MTGIDTKLILIEGIPGSGKTTLSRRAATYLSEKGRDVRHYAEGEAHPADLGWCACIPEEELESVLARFPGQRDALLARAERFSGYAVIPYLVFSENEALMTALEAYEVYDGRVPHEWFTTLHTARWARFAERAAREDAVSVFECAFFQNHVNELLFFRRAEYKQILAHMKKLLSAANDLNPLLIYLSQPDVAETIGRVAKERVSPRENWIERVIGYIENSPYGKARGYTGYEGTLRAFRDRRAIELALLSDLPIRSVSIVNPAYDWDSVFAQLCAALDAD